MAKINVQKPVELEELLASILAKPMRSQNF
jgi:hypothetical protein